jgi:hypothetical protein
MLWLFLHAVSGALLFLTAPLTDAGLGLSGGFILPLALETRTGRYDPAVPACGKRMAAIRVYRVTAPQHGDAS